MKQNVISYSKQFYKLTLGHLYFKPVPILIYPVTCPSRQSQQHKKSLLLI